MSAPSETSPGKRKLDVNTAARRLGDDEDEIARHLAALQKSLTWTDGEQFSAVREEGCHLSQVAPWLLVSDEPSASKCELLRQHGVTHVLNCGGPDCARDLCAMAAGALYKQVDALDRDGYLLLERHWDEAWSFIREALTQTEPRILIYCRAGINRAGCLAAAALMVHNRLPIIEAVRRCKEARGGVLLTKVCLQQELIRLAASEALLGPGPVSEPESPIRLGLARAPSFPGVKSWAEGLCSLAEATEPGETPEA